ASIACVVIFFGARGRAWRMAHCLATVEAASLLIPLPFPMAEIIHSPCDIRCRRGPILAESPVLSPRGQALTLSASDPQHPRQVLEPGGDAARSEEHTSELQSRENL